MEDSPLNVIPTRVSFNMILFVSSASSLGDDANRDDIRRKWITGAGEMLQDWAARATVCPRDGSNCWIAPPGNMADCFRWKHRYRSMVHLKATLYEHSKSACGNEWFYTKTLVKKAFKCSKTFLSNHTDQMFRAHYSFESVLSKFSLEKIKYFWIANI